MNKISQKIKKIDKKSIKDIIYYYILSIVIGYWFALFNDIATGEVITVILFSFFIIIWRLNKIEKRIKIMAA